MRKIALLFSFLFTSVLSVLAQQVNIAPTLLYFNAGPGLTQNQTIYLTNTSATKQAFELSLGDWTRNEDGSHTYYPPNTQPNSCANWVKLSTNFLEIEPGKTAEVRVAFQGPDKKEAYEQMRWAMLFLQNVAEKTADTKNQSKTNTQIKEVFRIGVHVYQTPPAVTKGEAKAESLVPGADTKSYVFTVKNTGQIMLQCKARLELTDIKTGKEYRFDPIEFPMFPGGSRKVNLAIPASVPKGNYSMLAVLDYGESYALEAVEKNVEVK